VWLKLISYLPQDPMLIEDTIKTNICLDLSKTSNKKIKKNLDTAITQANIKNFIRSLPNGINTKIGEFGIRLSGGQSKRVALARTFYHDKEIIVMDEATSSLDEKTENFILEQIKELKRKKTVIIITHNKNTLKYCDKVYEIINGKIRKK
jgi:ABC-type bacteriocin/lantibiotic exporter with double-glycine peptidase domain